MSSPERLTAPRRVHGGPDPIELRTLGLEVRDIIDFSVNVNPYGPAPSVAAAARSAELARYPDPGAEEVRAALAVRWKWDGAGVLFAHGATELLWDLARRVGRRGERALVVEPAFSEFSTALHASQAGVIGWRAAKGPDAPFDPEAVGEELLRSGARTCYLATPTSPLGLAVPHDAIARLASTHPSVLVVLDESFLALSDDHAEASRALPPNVVRVRSLTKEHAIPGLRVGYLLAEPGLVEELGAARPTWSTSAPAQAAALAAIAEQRFVEESRRRLASDREALRDGLARLGFAPWPSIAPYIAFRVRDAAALRHRLLARGVLVRDCASFGLVDVIRVAARPAADRAVLLAALVEVPP